MAVLGFPRSVCLAKEVLNFESLSAFFITIDTYVGLDPFQTDLVVL